ncbi:MAG TPA: isoprenylcysteine carboxylmethyltransferase family protein [Gemmatimonadaceae bacterium]|nr:isoprenylcysteine carboxylmethyltransferase family protein [Gemmatimonadaceae bacterium]
MGRKRGPAVRFPPPLLFVGGLLIGWLLETRVTRISVGESAGLDQALRVAGAVLAALGLIVIVSGILTFARAGTSILPMRPASTMVESGPYAYTRNPMYTGMALVYLGAAFLLDWVWPILLLPIVLLVLFRLVISREERYLAAEFGEGYEGYRRRVRRWI